MAESDDFRLGNPAGWRDQPSGGCGEARAAGGFAGSLPAAEGPIRECEQRIGGVAPRLRACVAGIWGRGSFRDGWAGRGWPRKGGSADRRRGRHPVFAGELLPDGTVTDERGPFPSSRSPTAIQRRRRRSAHRRAPAEPEPRPGPKRRIPWQQPHSPGTPDESEPPLTLRRRQGTGQNDGTDATGPGWRILINASQWFRPNGDGARDLHHRVPLELLNKKMRPNPHPEQRTELGPSFGVVDEQHHWQGRLAR